MSQLAPFVRAFRAMAGALGDEALGLNKAAELMPDLHTPLAAATLSSALHCAKLSAAFSAAATDLEQQIAKDLNRPGGTWLDGAGAGT